jgi:hypothetical protein
MRYGTKVCFRCATRYEGEHECAPGPGWGLAASTSVLPLGRMEDGELVLPAQAVSGEVEEEGSEQ